MENKDLYLNLRKSYPFNCYKCGYSQNANPSIMMAGFQANVGGGKCLKCGAQFSLEIDDKNEKMISSPVADKWGQLPMACYTTKEKVGVFV